MSLTTLRCPECNSGNHKFHTSYTVGSGEKREIRRCQKCGNYFSETKNTPLEGLRRPLSLIILVLNALNDGMSLNAACRTFGTTNKSIKRWLERLGGLKETLLLYALCHQFCSKSLKVTNYIPKLIRINQPPSQKAGPLHLVSSWTIGLFSLSPVHGIQEQYGQDTQSQPPYAVINRFTFQTPFHNTQPPSIRPGIQKDALGDHTQSNKDPERLIGKPLRPNNKKNTKKSRDHTPFQKPGCRNEGLP